MSADNQIIIPRSFVDLFVPAGRMRPTASHGHILARYELCEDLAQMLTETARERLHELHVTESDVLSRIRTGLEGGGVVESFEAAWVIRRLAELLGWPPLSE
ncbi:MAG: hypothetical protein RIS35_2323 [Pseudomonadota bacterium]|jgi:hypothetical protein